MKFMLSSLTLSALGTIFLTLPLSAKNLEQIKTKTYPENLKYLETHKSNCSNPPNLRRDARLAVGNYGPLVQMSDIDGPMRDPKNGVFWDQDDDLQKNYQFETYLNTYSREDMRECLGLGPKNEGSVLKKFRKRLHMDIQTPFAVTNQMCSNHRDDLFYCRLPKSFRECMKSEFIPRRDLEHYDTCQVELSQNQKHFYETYILRKSLNEATALDTSSSEKEFVDTKSNEEVPSFEKVLTDYHREKYRDTYFNPLTKEKLNLEQITFYPRIFIGFRICIARLFKDSIGIGRPEFLREKGMLDCFCWKEGASREFNELKVKTADGEEEYHELAKPRPEGCLRPIDYSYYHEIMLTEKSKNNLKIIKDQEIAAMKSEAERLLSVNSEDSINESQFLTRKVEAIEKAMANHEADRKKFESGELKLDSPAEIVSKPMTKASK